MLRCGSKAPGINHHSSVLKFNYTCVPEANPIPISYDLEMLGTLVLSTCLVFALVLACHPRRQGGQDWRPERHMGAIFDDSQFPI